jgi:hypothetical protein
MEGNVGLLCSCILQPTMKLHKIIFTYLYIALKVKAFLDQDRFLGDNVVHTSDPNENWISQVPAGAIHFSKLGTTIGSLHYAHLVMEFNVTSLERNITKLCRMTRAAWQANPYNYTSADPTITKHAPPKDPYAPREQYSAFSRRMARINHDIEEQCLSLLDDFRILKHIWLPSSEDTKRSKRSGRNKRQVGILIAFGIGLLVSYLYTHSSLLSINAAVNDDHESHTVQLLQKDETRLAMNNRSISIIKHAVETTKMNVYKLSKETDYVENVMELLTAFTTAQGQVRRIMDGLLQLPHYRLSPHLVKPEALKNRLASIKTAVEEKGLVLAIDHVEEVFHLPTSHIMFHNGTLRIFTHIPAYEQNSLLHLYRFESLPIPVKDNVTILPILPDQQNVIAVNSMEDKFRLFQEAELKDCERVQQLLYCPRSNYFDLRTEQSCLFALYRGRFALIKKNCDFTPIIKNDLLRQLSPQHYVLYQAQDFVITKKCPGRPSLRNTMFTKRQQGLFRVTVEAGCFVKTPSFYFEGSYSLYGDTQRINTDFLEDTSKQEVERPL